MKLVSIIIAIIYTLFPADVLPDIVPILGWLDDAALWFLIFWFFFLRLRGTDAPFSDASGTRQETGGASEDRRRESREAPGGHGGQDRKDPYTILGVDRNASPEEIKKAYRRLAATYHPDKFAHLGEAFQKTAEERFKEIQEAYQTLMPRH